MLDSSWVPEEPIGWGDAAVETAGALGCKDGTAAAAAVVAAGEAVATRHRQRQNTPMESNRRFEGVADAEVGRIVGELRLGWRIGMCPVPVDCHMSIAGDDGRDRKREELGCPRYFDCEDR